MAKKLERVNLFEFGWDYEFQIRQFDLKARSRLDYVFMLHLSDF